MPSSSTIFRWLLDEEKKEFWEQYAKVRAIQAETKFEELLDVADDASNDWYEREWYLSKVLAKKFGDKREVDVTLSDGYRLADDFIRLPGCDRIRELRALPCDCAA
jgi:hypothetical protein